MRARTLFPSFPLLYLKAPRINWHGRGGSHLVVITVPRRTSLRNDWRREGRRESERAAFGLERLVLWIMLSQEVQGSRKTGRGKAREEDMGWEGKRKGEAWEEIVMWAPLPTERNGGLQMEREGNWMGDSCRGLWMEIDSWISGRRDRGVGGWGPGYLMDVEKMRR